MKGWNRQQVVSRGFGDLDLEKGFRTGFYNGDEMVAQQSGIDRIGQIDIPVLRPDIQARKNLQRGDIADQAHNAESEHQLEAQAPAER